MKKFAFIGFIVVFCLSGHLSPIFGAQQLLVHKPVRIGLAMLIDRYALEEPADQAFTEGSIGAITGELSKLIASEGDFCILTSRSLLYNFVVRKQHWNDPNHPENKQLKDIVFSDDHWELFYIRTTQFVLLLPKKKKCIKKVVREAFNIDGQDSLFKNITSKLANYSELEVYLNQLECPDVALSDFKKIFKTYTFDIKPRNNIKSKSLEREKREIIQNSLDAQKHGVSWVVYLSGHGLETGTIANFSVREMRLLLDLFNRDINTELFFISTCYGGGQHADQLRFLDAEKQIVRPLNYVLMVQGIEDVTVRSINPARFLSNVLACNSFSVDNVKSVYNLSLSEDALHAQTNIVQTFCSYDFFPINVSDFIASIGPVLYQAHKFENKPIEFKHDPSVILLYPQIIDVPVIVRPLNIKRLAKEKIFSLCGDFSKNKKVQWAEFPTAAEFILNNCDKIDLRDHLLIKKNSKSVSRKKIDYFSRYKMLLFPAFIPKQRSDIAVQFLSEIQVSGDVDYLGNGVCDRFLAMGVLTFLRDAFFDVNPDQRSIKIFNIGSLVGFNDITPLLFALRFVNNTHKSALETALKAYINKKITLKNVIVRVGFDKSIRKIVRQLRFDFAGATWVLNGPFWQFEKQVIK